MSVEYSTYFSNLIIGRQSVFQCYMKLYECAQKLKHSFRINIYDQVTDIDGVDFILRCEGKSEIMHIECQVKTTQGALLYIAKNGSIKPIVDKCNEKNVNLLVFAVDKKHNQIFFYSNCELDSWYNKENKSRMNLLTRIPHIKKLIWCKD